MVFLEHHFFCVVVVVAPVALLFASFDDENGVACLCECRLCRHLTVSVGSFCRQVLIHRAVSHILLTAITTAISGTLSRRTDMLLRTTAARAMWRGGSAACGGGVPSALLRRAGPSCAGSVVGIAAVAMPVAVVSRRQIRTLPKFGGNTDIQATVVFILISMMFLKWWSFYA